MNKLILRLGTPFLFVLIALMLIAAPASARPASQEDDQVEHGRYIAEIAGCLGCHTPIDPATFQPLPDMLGAGGYAFPLGELGTVFTKNLTSDPATGLGDWTDEEIKTAFTTGVSRDGLHLFPIMPYRFFNKMSEEDADAVVAFLRTLDPVENPIERRQILPVEALPQLPREDPLEVAPDPSDTVARGDYLFNAILPCEDCHTPLDAETQAPIQDMYFAGGQPYEGPWGIVYGANITPDDETGIGTWTDAEIERVLRTGVRPDGRVAVLMPFIDYKNLSEDDMKAIIAYLRRIEPINNEVPAPELAENFEIIVPIETEEAATEATEAPQSSTGNMPVVAISAGVVFVLLAVVVFMAMRRRNQPPAG